MLNKIPFSQAIGLLKEGDILLFRGSGWVSSLIQRASEGRYSHVGVASAYIYGDDIIWECVEFREWKGGRSVNLQKYVEMNDGNIDVYRPSSSKKIADYVDGKVVERTVKYNGHGVTKTMRLMTGLPYGWTRILWIAQHKLPLIRTIYDINLVVNDTLQDLVYPVCSTAVSYSCAKNDWDLTHHRADAWMEPSDVARSALIHYVFTLVTG